MFYLHYYLPQIVGLQLYSFERFVFVYPPPSSRAELGSSVSSVLFVCDILKQQSPTDSFVICSITSRRSVCLRQISCSSPGLNTKHQTLNIKHSCFLIFSNGLFLFIALFGQSADTALDEKGWQGVSYSLLTKTPCQPFTSKLEE